jgi:ABC-type polysaccharide/polyol phosphate transport system ATPase subunit
LVKFPLAVLSIESLVGFIVTFIILFSLIIQIYYMSTLLETKEVSKYFGEFQALDAVSIQVPKHSIFGLLGPNGAGKTTLIRIINQITKANLSK